MMNCTKVKEFIKNNVNDLFSCYQENNYLVIKTPFSYPDGDDIELFMEFKDNYTVISDLGETLRFIDTYLLNTNTKRRKSILQDIANSHNIRIHKGQLHVIIKNQDRLLEALFNLSQAIIRASDLLFTQRGQSFASFEEEVKNFLDDYNLNYEQNYIVETSNNQFDFEFAIESKDGIKLLKLINAPNSNTSNLVNRTLRIWVEIEKERGIEYPKNHRFTLLDDSFYTWKPGEYQILEHFSYVNKWTQREDLIKKIS